MLFDLPNNESITLHEVAQRGGLGFNAVPQDRLLPGTLLDASVSKLQRYGQISENINQLLGRQGIRETAVQKGQRFVDLLNSGVGAYNRAIFEGPASRLQVAFLEQYGKGLADDLFRQGYNKTQIIQVLGENARLFASAQTSWGSVANSPARRAIMGAVFFSSEPEAFGNMLINALIGAPRLAAITGTSITSPIFNRIPLPRQFQFLRGRVQANGSEIWARVAVAMYVGTASLAQAIHAFSTTINEGKPQFLGWDRLFPIKYDPYSPVGISYNSNWLSPDLPGIQTSNGAARLDLVGPWDVVLRLLDFWPFLRSRGSQISRLVIDNLVGENFVGEPFENGLDRFYHSVVTAFLPIGAEELADAVVGDSDEPRLGFAGTAIQATTGFNLRSPTTAEGRDTRAIEYAREIGAEGIEGWSDLNLIDMRRLNYDADYLKERVRILQAEVDRYGADSGQVRLLERFRIDGKFLFSRYEATTDLIIGLWGGADYTPDQARVIFARGEDAVTARRVDDLNELYGNYGEAETDEIDGTEQAQSAVNTRLQRYFDIIQNATIGQYQDRFNTEKFKEERDAYFEEDPLAALIVKQHQDAFPIPEFLRLIDDAYDEISAPLNTGNSLLDRARGQSSQTTARFRARVLEIIQATNALPSDLIDVLVTGNFTEENVARISDKLKEHFDPTLIGLAEEQLQTNRSDTP